MTPTGCPRCVAERRARWLHSGAQVSGVMGAVLLLAGSRFRRGHATDWPTLSIFLALAATLAGIALGLHYLNRRFERRASTPLPPPAADPLATYRAAHAECPRHPFARPGEERAPRRSASRMNEVPSDRATLAASDQHFDVSSVPGPWPWPTRSRSRAQILALAGLCAFQAPADSGMLSFEDRLRVVLPQIFEGGSRRALASDEGTVNFVEVSLFDERSGFRVLELDDEGRYSISERVCAPGTAVEAAHPRNAHPPYCVGPVQGRLSDVGLVRALFRGARLVRPDHEEASGAVRRCLERAGLVTCSPPARLDQASELILHQLSAAIDEAVRDLQQGSHWARLEGLSGDVHWITGRSEYEGVVFENDLSDRCVRVESVTPYQRRAIANLLPSPRGTIVSTVDQDFFARRCWQGRWTESR